MKDCNIKVICKKNKIKMNKQQFIRSSLITRRKWKVISEISTRRDDGGNDGSIDNYFSQEPAYILYWSLEVYFVFALGYLFFLPINLTF